MFVLSFIFYLIVGIITLMILIIAGSISFDIIFYFIFYHYHHYHCQAASDASLYSSQMVLSSSCVIDDIVFL